MAGQYAPPLHQGNGNMVLMTNPEDELDKLEANFRGDIINNEGEIIPNKLKRRMNEEGINQVMGMIRSIVNRITFMSHLDDKNLYSMLDWFADTLAQLLMVSKIQFMIKSDADRTAIFFESVALAHIAMRRGWKEGDRRFWKGTTHEVAVSNPGMNPDSGLMKWTPKSWRG